MAGWARVTGLLSAGVALVVGSGKWLGPKSRCAGCEPVTLDDRVVPGCPPGPAYLRAVGVDEELAVDGVADVSLEGPERFFLGLALGDLRSK